MEFGMIPMFNSLTSSTEDNDSIRSTASCRFDQNPMI